MLPTDLVTLAVVPSLIPRTVALLAAGTLVVAMFLPWSAEGRLALDASIGDGGQPTVATVLVLIAALPAFGALVGDAGWPRLLTGLATAAVVLGWLAAGPDGRLVSGVLTALGAAAGLLLAAALATGEGGGAAVDEPRPDRGHAFLDHTADVAFEAWGPTRAACYEEAVRALVGSFAEPSDAAPEGRWDVDLPPWADDDLLVDLLGEVIYVVDTRGAVPVAVTLRDREDGGLAGRLDLVSIGTVRPSGAVPKAITYHGLAVDGGPDGWRCRVTVDV